MKLPFFDFSSLSIAVAGNLVGRRLSGHRPGGRAPAPKRLLTHGSVATVFRLTIGAPAAARPCRRSLQTENRHAFESRFGLMDCLGRSGVLLFAR
jgi:hypothetical protein